MLASIVAIAAVVVAAVSFLASQREVRRRARVDYVDQLERRITECEKDRGRLRDELHTQREENLELMRRIFRLEGPG